MPRVAFCFHHSQPSGATIWLQRFLESGVAPIEAEAIIPAESPVAESLRLAGIPVHDLGLEERAITEAGAKDAARLLLNRVGALARYREILHDGKFDAAYINSSVNIVPLMAAKGARIPAIVHVHEIPITASAFALKRALIRRWADGCLFASQRGMAAFGPQPAGRRWEFCPNGVPEELAALAEKREALRIAKGFLPGEKIILFVGNLGVPKGVHHLLETWKSISEKFPVARLVLAGPHALDKSHPLIADAVAGKITGVDALGFRADAVELLAAADLFVLPSLAEAMPLSVIEAMMVGTPVIVRDVGDVAWLLADGRGIVYEKEAELAGILASVLNGKRDTEEMTSKAREFAKRELTSRRQKTQVLEFIRSVVKK